LDPTVVGAFSDEPDPLEITVAAEVVGTRGDSLILHAVVEDGTAADGGDIEVKISRSAASSYGIDACIDELESVLNRTLRPAYRLSAALAMGAQGAFLIVTTGASGPRVVVPAPGELAA
jgi:hypothetical protein